MMKKIGVIGCGNMGEAIIRRVAAHAKNHARSITITDIDASRRAGMRRRYRVSVAGDARSVVAASDIVILAVKPRDFDGLLGEIRPIIGTRTLVISIAAGITTRYIEQRLGKRVPVIRIMPNMPAVIGAAISSVSAGRFAKPKDVAAAKEIFSLIGDAVAIEERLVDAVTAVSGSGPAYFFYLVESMVEAAKRLGLGEAAARELVTKTALGSAKLLAVSIEGPDVLRARVTSKGGTTEAAFTVFAAEDFKGMVARAVKRACARSKELSKR